MTFEYPSYPELAASVRIRQNIVEAARRTALSFHTTKIERPEDYWTYTEESGFTILPGKPLIEALRKAIDCRPRMAIPARPEFLPDFPPTT